MFGFFKKPDFSRFEHIDKIVEECSTCDYFRKGSCRRNGPPWPDVKPDDWCGRYRNGDIAEYFSVLESYL